MTHTPVELGENVDVHLLRLFVYVLQVSVQVQTHLVMGFGNLTPRNGVVTEPHKSLLTSACWLRL